MTKPLQPIGLGHARVLAEMHRICFAEPWDERAMADLLAMPGAFGILASDQVPHGFVLARTAFDEAEILTLLVLPPYRRKGMASTLLKSAMHHARDSGATTLFLEVAANNVGGRALYSALGFEQVGRRPDYYHHQVDALVMKCYL